jgi:hypothetical protein
VDGEWVRRHGRWYWLVGRWVRTPPRATYSPWVLVRSEDGTPFYAPSVWKNAQGEPIPPPPAIVLARSSGEAVVDANNEVEPTGRNLDALPASRSYPPSPKSEAATEDTSDETTDGGPDGAPRETVPGAEAGVFVSSDGGAEAPRAPSEAGAPSSRP